MDNNSMEFDFEQQARKMQLYFKNLTLKKIYLMLVGLTVVIVAFSMYVGLQSFSIHSAEFRFFLIFLCMVWGAPFFIKYKSEKTLARGGKVQLSKGYLLSQIMLGIGVAIAIVTMVFSVISSPILISDDYYDLIDMQENGSFTENVESYENMLIPIVDYSLAEKLGDKKLGEDNLGSQFTIDQYSMIYQDGDIYWVGALEYTGFFKWMNNKDTGSPGYIKISATNPSDVQIVACEMQYIESAYFGQDMARNMYLSNMGKYIAYDYSFEIDDEGNPYYIKAVYENEFSFVNGLDAVGVILLNAVTGDVEYYDMGSEPSWVDKVVPANIVLTQLNYYGEYVHGFFNTLFAKKEIVNVTDGYNYIYSNDKFYLYTGLTSIGNDESIVGVVLSDAKTKETTFYSIGGATEYAAKSSAEGMVQDLGYTATQPILINYLGEPTYFTMLKDAEGLVKRYAYVNVKEYQNVGIGETIAAAQVSYNKILSLTDDENSSVTLTIDQIIAVVDDATTYYYIKFADEEYAGTIYIAHISTSTELPFYEDGDVVTVTLSQGMIVTIK